MALPPPYTPPMPVALQRYPVPAAATPRFEGDIEVPVEPDIETPVEADEELPPAQPPSFPVDYPIWDEDAIARAQAAMDEEQAAKNQLVALAANVAHVETVINELRARVEALEAK